MSKWDAFASPKVTVGYAASTIPPEVIHASSRPSPRKRRYVAPNNDAPVDDMQPSSGHQRPAARFVAPPSTLQVAPLSGSSHDSPHDGTSHSRRNQSSGDRKQHVCIRMFLPSTFSETSGRDEHARARELRSWRDLPANPLDGLPGLVPEQPPMEREDCKFYCDPCQKGFFTQERYERHMKDHIWCTFPGCKFTCQKGKEWKMAVHAETLHNRPDAPDLADVGSYLAQRKNRFPTQETVKSKVEELFYKASRGVTLPDERRRWLRQHGVLVRKHPRTEETYIASDALRQATNAAAVKAAERHRDQHQEQQQKQQQKEQQQGPQNLPEGIARDVYSKEEATAAVQRHTDHDRPKRIIPLGPNGTLTRGQKVQLMRDKYRDAKTVPRFYVCHRCGEKGTHWVDECPTKGDEAFERQIVWGEERREPPRQRQRTEADAETTATAAEVDYVATQGYAARVGDDPTALYNGARLMPHTVACRSDAPGPADGALEIVEDGGPPAEVSARRHEDVDATGQTPDVTRVLAPVAAAARGRGRRNEQLLQRKARPRPPPPPTLFERLVEGEQTNKRGLLLQACRFFVMRKFFKPL